MKRVILAALVVMVAMAMTVPALAQDEAPAPGKSDTLKWAEENFHYVGSKKCKMCHKDQFASWEKTKHANAWATLSEEEQKKECAGCHMVGMDEEGEALVNVGCEACHGPGSEYKSMKAMKDPKLASAAGLLPITEETCVRCHNKKSPSFKGFKYEEALKTGVHEHFTKEEKK